MELERDVLVSPAAEVPVVDGEVVTAIRTLCGRGVGKKSIARELGVSISTVRRYLRRSIEAGRQVRPGGRGLTDAWRDLARAFYQGPAAGNGVVVQRLAGGARVDGERAHGRARGGRYPARSGSRNWRRSALMAEREGFEPSVEFPLHTLSKRAPSTTRTSLRLESTAYERCTKIIAHVRELRMILVDHVWIQRFAASRGEAGDKIVSDLPISSDHLRASAHPRIGRTIKGSQPPIIANSPARCTLRENGATPNGCSGTWWTRVRKVSGSPASITVISRVTSMRGISQSSPSGAETRRMSSAGVDRLKR
jgi:hypothetical protein